MFDGQFFPGQAIQFEQESSIRNPWYRHRLIDVIQRQGLTGNLRLCLDAADGNSLPASSTKWLDTSGNGYDFFRGTTAGADATDPTINGTADGRSDSEYLSFDGGDYLTYDTTNETWMQNLHKDNALFTILMWVWPDSFSTNYGLLGTSGFTATNVGVNINLTSTGNTTLRVSNGSAGIALNQGIGTLTEDAWNCVAISMDEANSILRGFRNDTTNSFNVNYSSPSASNATYTMQIGAAGNATNIIPTGYRFSEMAIWEGVTLTDAQISAVFQATRGRFKV